MNTYKLLLNSDQIELILNSLENQIQDFKGLIRKGIMGDETMRDLTPEIYKKIDEISAIHQHITDNRSEITFI